MQRSSKAQLHVSDSDRQFELDVLEIPPHIQGLAQVSLSTVRSCRPMRVGLSVVGSLCPAATDPFAESACFDQMPMSRAPRPESSGSARDKAAALPAPAPPREKCNLFTLWEYKGLAPLFARLNLESWQRRPLCPPPLPHESRELHGEGFRDFGVPWPSRGKNCEQAGPPNHRNTEGSPQIANI